MELSSHYVEFLAAQKMKTPQAVHECISDKEQMKNRKGLKMQKNYMGVGDE